MSRPVTFVLRVAIRRGESDPWHALTYASRAQSAGRAHHAALRHAMRKAWEKPGRAEAVILQRDATSAAPIWDAAQWVNHHAPEDAKAAMGVDA